MGHHRDWIRRLDQARRRASLSEATATEGDDASASSEVPETTGIVVSQKARWDPANVFRLNNNIRSQSGEP
jgi:hypothetical protein